MEKKIRKKYYSEEAVKKALQIDSFRNLSKEKVMEFTSMIPYMEKEVAMEVIKQFPVYVDFAKTVIEHYTQICETILATNKEEYEKAVDAHQFVLESFSKQLENENLTAEERANLSDKMIAEAEKITTAEISRADNKNNRWSGNGYFRRDSYIAWIKSNRK